MKTPTKLIITTVLAVMMQPVFAQSSDDQPADEYHPFMTDTFNLEIGAFWPQIGFGARVDGSTPSEEIDFDQALNIKDDQLSISANFRWRFGEKWSLWGQYWGTDNKGSATLEEDIEWDDNIFKEGTFAKTGINLDIVRVFVGRQFDLSPHHEFGIGGGLHWMKLDTFLEGEVIVDDTSTEFRRVSASASIPLPNLGIWYMYSWSPKWMLNTRADWLDVSLGDYSGSLIDAQVGINYQAFKNVGFGLYYKAFKLNVDIDKDDWSGKVDLNQNGPLLTVTASW